ncbi:MAG: PhoX family phosphatase [Sneathiellaceae bacterium]
MASEPGLSRIEAFHRSDDIPSNPTANPTIGDVLATRFGRRDLLKGLLGTTVVAGLAGGLPLPWVVAPASAAAPVPGYDFTEIAHGVDETHHVAPGHRAEVLIRWGDRVTADAPAFDPIAQSAESQKRQFGYNNDYIGFLPLPADSPDPDRGLLFVNHEYTIPDLMFAGLKRDKDDPFAGITAEMVATEMAAHGASIVEIGRAAGGSWAVVPDSRYNRRITTLETAMDLTGPCAGHDALKTSADPSGRTVIGMVNNCAGGTTPWGTVLTAEENFNGYFMGAPAAGADAATLKRYGIPGGWYNWGAHDPRFDIGREPNEANRFGWIVEVDPYDPLSRPKKRTALGRFKHEGASTVVDPDGTVVAMSGDDERFDYVYRFVADGTFDPANRMANMDLLDAGTLSVARFDADGRVAWLPLVFGQGPLTAASGFADQADVLIRARLAADALGATRMDRPEDVEINPVTRKAYVALTNNSRRKEPDAANPRAGNIWGQIVEMVPADGRFAGEDWRWEILVLAGNPADPATGASYHPATSENGWFACPDNLAVDPKGRLGVSTDQGGGWSKASGTADGVWALQAEGPERGTGRMFFRVPVGAEMCGPVFSDDGTTLFVAVQHPAADGAKEYAPFGRESTFEDPATRWPDFAAGMPPRPSVMTIRRDDGGPVGG